MSEAVGGGGAGGQQLQNLTELGQAHIVTPPVINTNLGLNALSTAPVILQLPNGFNNLTVQDIDNHLLLDVLGIGTPEDSRKLMGEEQTFTDLLPATPVQGQTQYLTSNVVLDIEGNVQSYVPAQLPEATSSQQEEFIQQLVTECQESSPPPPRPSKRVRDSSSNDSLNPGTPSAAAGPAPKRRRCRRDNADPDSHDTPKPKPQRKRRSKPKKPKVYELQTPLPDPESEKKRLNAINAKKNRDQQKVRLQDLDKKVQDITTERDYLRQEVETLKERENQLRQELLTRFGYTFPLL